MRNPSPATIEAMAEALWESISGGYREPWAYLTEERKALWRDNVVVMLKAGGYLEPSD